MSDGPDDGVDKADDRQGRVVRVGEKILEIVEDALYLVIALLLVAGAAVIAVRGGYQLTKLGDEGTETIVLSVLNDVLLTFIFVELLFAVRSTLVRHEIVVQPFLLVGILVAIKEVVLLSPKAQQEYLTEGPEFARSMVEIGLLGGVVLVFSVAIFILRRSDGQPATEASEDASGHDGSGAPPTGSAS